MGSNPAVGMDVCCECCVLSGTGICDELITRPEESYRLWCVVVCDIETTKILVNEEEAKAHWGAIGSREKTNHTSYKQVLCVIQVVVQ